MLNYDGIRVKVLGDSSPFSKTGKSSGYLVTVKDKDFLIDCGAPIFQILDPETIENLEGVIITHLHDDHKRWFTDLALYKKYVTKKKQRLKLLTSETLLNDLRETSIHALQRTLSSDSKSSVDVPYSEFVEEFRLGPKAKYWIDNKSLTTTHHGVWRVMNQTNEYLAPNQAKVIIHPKTFSKRLLFKDPLVNLWVEPDAYYPFDSSIFYEDCKIYEGEGFTIEAFKSHNWHGLTGIGIKISTENESVFFSGDTTYNLNLFQSLTREVRKIDFAKTKHTEKDFERTHLIIGDINDFNQKTWSEERLTKAMKVYEKSVVFHESASIDSILHTDYENIVDINAEEVILVHTPDRFVSREILSHHDKVFVIVKNSIYEQVYADLFKLDADFFFRDTDKFYVAYVSENGIFKVVVNDEQLLDIVPSGKIADGRTLCNVDLFEDIQGKYFKYLTDENTSYRLRKDGKIERLITTDFGSSAEVVKPLKREYAPFSSKSHNKKKSDTGIRSRY